jgi:thiamine-phosphate pyrophosphorylase
VLSIELPEHLADALFVIGKVFLDDDARRLHADLRKQDSLEGMMNGLPRLYAIVDRATLEARGVGVGAFVEELREAGVRLVQYRDKVSAPEEILRAAAEIRAAFAGVDATLILNDRADLAVLAGWDGVHVGQGDLTVAAVRRVLGAGKIVGMSTHTEEQVRVADLSGADYVAVGPVFATASKADAEAVIGLEGVRRARALTTKPLVAIGGITRQNAASVVEAGADSVAVIGALLVAGEWPGDVARDFLKILG